jgi:toxin YoeB
MIKFTPVALEHLSYWIETDRKTALRILRLIQETERNPFGGIGKPEPLKGDFKGYWSRRIDEEHRLIYTIINGELVIHSCRFHYTK